MKYPVRGGPQAPIVTKSYATKDLNADTYNKAGKVFRHTDIDNLQVRVKFGGSEFALD
ncbi:MAG: hypothetical protein FJZ00_10870 [Candidatus Sericytochromatia bacterium]|uniref:Uncharacterized protein n=1 Tax=Candidatus Tanganyikabacteria bacterium TaxID=2961651 RepID=A0A937X6H1_9BACT|nr:hypothetical protein [Candidatus Tanganyikabacteria bacterium]